MKIRRPDTKNTLLAQIKSNSMWPTLQKNDMVLLVLAPLDDIRIGDVIGFTSAKHIPLAHRVAHMSKNTVQTIADASRRYDDHISDTAIIGKVIMKKQGNKWQSYPRYHWGRYIHYLIARTSSMIVKHPGALLYRMVRKLLLFISLFF